MVTKSSRRAVVDTAPRLTGLLKSRGIKLSTGAGTLMPNPQTRHRMRAVRRSRFMHLFLHSDLLGVPITLAFFGIFAVSLTVVCFAANLGGILFIALIGGLCGLFLTLEGRNAPEGMEGVRPEALDGVRRVLVVANRGLEEAALAEVCQRGTGTGTEAMIIAPVVASSRLHKLTDDIGAELSIAQHRVDVALATLKSKGIKANGHPAPGDPIDALLDGLRQFQASEVVMLSGGETGWDEASIFAERVRNEVGLLVTEQDPTARHLVSAPTDGGRIRMIAA